MSDDKMRKIGEPVFPHLKLRVLEQRIGELEERVRLLELPKFGVSEASEMVSESKAAKKRGRAAGVK